MCRLCDEGKLQNHDDVGSPQNRDDEGKPPGYFGSRRDFLKAATATGVAAGGSGLFAAGPAAAHDGGPPEDHGRRKRRYVIRGGPRDVDGPEGGRFRPGRRAGRGQEDPCRRTEPARGRRGRDRRPRQDRHARLRRHPPPPGLDGDKKLHSRQHPDRRRLGHAERGIRTTSATSCSVSPRVPAGGRVHQRAVRRLGAARQRRHDGRTTSRRSITRPSTRTPPSRLCSIPGVAPPSAFSRAPGPAFSAPIPTTSIRRTPPASRSGGSRRAISSST